MQPDERHAEKHNTRDETSIYKTETNTTPVHSPQIYSTFETPIQTRIFLAYRQTATTRLSRNFFLNRRCNDVIKQAAKRTAINADLSEVATCHRSITPRYNQNQTAKGAVHHYSNNLYLTMCRERREKRNKKDRARGSVRKSSRHRVKIYQKPLNSSQAPAIPQEDSSSCVIYQLC